MLLLALRNLRARLGRTLFTAFAIALGVALMFATRIISVAAEQQAAAARESKLAGADLEVTSARAKYFPLSLSHEILNNPAVERVAPLYRHTLTASNLTLLGVDPTQILSPYELIAGEDLPGFENSQVIWLPDTWAAQNGLGVGQTVRLEIAGEPYDFKVVGLLKANSFGAATAWLPLSTLQAALHTPEVVNSVLVRLKPGTTPKAVRDELAEGLGTAYVVTSVQDTTFALQGTTVLNILAFQFASVVILLASAYLIFNTFALTLTERKREIGQLRALGMTRGQVLAQTLTEALLIASVGSLAGLPLGLGMAVVLIRSALGMDDAVNVVGAAGQIQLANIAVPLDGAVLAVSVSLLVTLVVTFRLAWQASYISPLTALTTVGDERGTQLNLYERWGWLGVVALTVLFFGTNSAVAAYLSQGDTATSPILYTFIPLLAPPFIAILIIPVFMRGALWLLERSFPQVVIVRLAARNIRKQKTRALLTTVMFAISFMLVISFAGMASGWTNYIATQGAPLLAADFLLLREGIGDAGGPPPISPALAADLDALRAEAEVFDFGGTHIPDYDMGADGSVVVTSLAYLRAHPSAAIPVEGSLDEAERYSAAGPTIFLTEIAARRHGLHVGDQAVISTLEGPVTFTVGLVQVGFTIVPLEYGVRYFGAHPTIFLVNTLPGQDKATLADRMKELAEKHGMQWATDPERWANDGLSQGLGALLALFIGLTSLSGIIASLNLINLLVASVLERQREIGALRALGLTRAQVRGLIVVEAGLLGLIGSLLGVFGAFAISWASVQLFAAWFSAALGPATKIPRLPWELAGVTVLLGPGIAMLAALWPADRAASVNPADAMRAEGATGFLPPAKHLGPIGLRGLVARMPLAAKLSFTTGLIIVFTIAALTALRVNYERQLLEENMRAIFARGLELMVSSTQSQLSAEVTELTPALVTGLFQQSGGQADSLNGLFQGGNSPYDFSLKYVLITDNQHKVILSNRAEYNNRVLTDTVTLAGSASNVRFTAWTGERAFEAAMAIENQAGRQLGYAVVGLSTEPVDNITRDIVRGSVGMMTAALAVAVALTVFFTRRALAPLSQIAEASQAVARGDLTQRIPEARWDEVGRVARSFNEMVHGLNDRERMRDLFGRYLSREVGEVVLAGRVSLAGERKTITVLYCDMRGSTTFVESHAPEDVMAALNQYFEVIILATEAHGGIVNRFVGDEAVCVFGAPTETRDHAERAVQAALAMREGLSYANQKRTALGQPILKFGMGLNTGEVTAGATGSEERQEYTLIGDAMNVGARIQALNKVFPDYDILLSEFTRTALKNDYNLVDLGLVELRGKSEMVRVFGVGSP